MIITIIVLLVVLALPVVFGLVVYNNLVRLKVKVDNGWAQIDVQLNRRSDLIPNLIETVKGYASHEKETLNSVVAARQAASSAQTPVEKAEADNMLTGALGKLFALSESYPDLKANQNFLQLQEELTATEDKIAYAKQFYNDTVRGYNTKIQQFPALIVAKMLNFNEREFYQISDPNKREAPRVEF